MFSLRCLAQATLVVVALTGCEAPESTAANAPTSRDRGSSEATAIPVPSIGAEYEWIARNRPGWTPTEQLLLIDGNKAYDLITIRKGSITDEIYFDISSFFGRY